MATVLASDVFEFADGGSGKMLDLGSAPTAGQFDILVIHSVTTITSVTGFTKREDALGNQDADLWDRVAVGGEGQTITVTTNGNHPTNAHWWRVAGLDAYSDSGQVLLNNSNGTAFPDGDTGALAASGMFMCGAGCLNNFDGALSVTPSWDVTWTADASGSQGSAGTSSALVTFGGHKDGVGTAAQPTDVLSWTNNARNRTFLWAVYTPDSAPPDVEGALAETAPVATESVAGDAPRVGVLAETAPVATDSVSGDVPAVGALAETVPAASDTLSGGASGTGALAETAPAAMEVTLGTSLAVTVGALLAMPTTTITVYAPTQAPDEWSGERTGDAAVASGIPASIIEQVRTVHNPQTGTPRVVRNVTGRVPDGTLIEPTSRVVDAEDRTYAVGSVRQVRNPLWVGDVVLELYRTDGVSP